MENIITIVLKNKKSVLIFNINFILIHIKNITLHKIKNNEQYMFL